MHPFEGRAIYDPVSELRTTDILKLNSVRVLADLSAIFYLGLILFCTGELTPETEDSGLGRYFPQVQSPMSLLTFSSAFFKSDCKSRSSLCKG